jgi:hypothetical protein
LLAAFLSALRPGARYDLRPIMREWM